MGRGEAWARALMHAELEGFSPPPGEAEPVMRYLELLTPTETAERWFPAGDEADPAGKCFWVAQMEGRGWMRGPPGGEPFPAVEMLVIMEADTGSVRVRGLGEAPVATPVATPVW
jgi:hypothetical protein